MREIVDKHREITGQISSAYEHIEVDPAVITQITSKRFKLQIGLERLAKYLALDDEWFDLLCHCDGSESKIRMGEIEFEKLMLKEGFIKQPCSRDLYTQLRTEFVELGYVRGMEFMEYYQWFRRSEGIFEASGKISDESAAAMDTVIRSWHASGNSSDDIRYWLNRNFKIHPRHRDAVSHFIDVVVAGQVAIQDRPFS